MNKKIFLSLIFIFLIIGIIIMTRDLKLEVVGAILAASCLCLGLLGFIFTLDRMFIIVIILGSILMIVSFFNDSIVTSLIGLVLVIIYSRLLFKK